jgi:hypothetical protein
MQMQSQRRYNSVEEIERDFEARIAQVDDPLEKAELRVQMAEARIGLRNQEANDRMVDAWKRLALTEFPAASKFPELVRGSTEDEIRASAREVAERVGQLQATPTADSFDQLRDQATQLYGRTGTGGTGPGGGMPSSYVSPDKAEERWAGDFARRFNDAPRDMYGVRVGISPSEVDRYARQRFVSQIQERVGFWGQITNSSYRR